MGGGGGSILRTRKGDENKKIPQALNESTLNRTLRHYVLQAARERDESSWRRRGVLELISLAGVAHPPLVTPRGTPQSTLEVLAARLTLPRNSDLHCAGRCGIDSGHTVDAAYRFHGIVSLTTAAM